MRFLAPQWLWCLAVLPALFWIAILDERRRQREFEKFAQRSVWRTLAPEMDPSARLRKMGLWVASLAFAVLAMSRPQWGTHEESIKTTGLDIMIALDVSNSMETEDVVPSRLKKSKHLIKTLVERLRGDRVGVVAFAASSYVACPLTTDLDYLLETLQIMGPRMVTNQGTDVGIALETARKALERGAEEVNHLSTSNNPVAAEPDPSGHSQPVSLASRIVILVSDGEDHEQGALDAAKALKDTNAKVYVLGVGTEKGGLVPVRDDEGALQGYKKDPSGQAVVSSFKPDALMQVAQAAGGRYWNVTVDEGEVEELLQDMGALNRTEYAERRYLVYEDRFQYPLAIAVLLLLLEISAPIRKARKRLLLGILAVRPAMAVSLFQNSTSIDAYRENERGIQAYKEGRAEEAQKRFGSAQALDPKAPELQYNNGLMQLQQGDAETAARSFDEAARGALSRGDPGLQGKALFNRAEALKKKGDLQEAAKSYLGAIASAERAKDEDLQKDARKNLELMVWEKQKEKQKMKEDKDGKESMDKKEGSDQKDQKGGNEQDKDKKDQAGKDKNDDDQGDQNKPGKDGPKQYADPSKDGRKQQFRSAKLNKEDAERVMSEMSSREKMLQSKLRKQSGNVQRQSKDW